jgi:hypothetical protein
MVETRASRWLTPVISSAWRSTLKPPPTSHPPNPITTSWMSRRQPIETGWARFTTW